MKKWICLLFAPMLCVHAQRKDLTLDDLVKITYSGHKEMVSLINKHGFAVPKALRNEDEIIYLHKQSSKNDIYKSLTPLVEESGRSVVYKTVLEDEFNLLKEDAANAGFKQIITDKPAVNETNYQKLELLLTYRILREEDRRVYEVELTRTHHPAPASFVYAEDLLQVQSHEMLAAIFGIHNVKLDTLMVDEDQQLICSILFPNTYSEALLFWKDKINKQSLEMIVVGEKLNGWKGSLQNKWHSRQGIYLGMPLKELLSANKEHFNVFGLKTDYPGFVVPDSPGAINFKKLGVQLTCMDFSDEKEFTSSSTFTTASLLAKTDRVYVDKMVILQ